MPNRQTHVIVGALAGGGFAAYRAKELEATNRFFEILGGVVGGYAGSRFPDIIEPAFRPDHRQFAHSVAAGGAIATATCMLLGEWERSCRFYGEYYHNRKTDENINELERFLYSLLEILLYLASGTLAGLSAGYLSHLILDGFTPNSLPILQ